MEIPLAFTDKLTLKGTGFSFESPAESSVNHDFDVPFDCIIEGGEFFAIGNGIANVKAEVFEHGNSMGKGFPDGTKLDIFLDGWKIKGDAEPRAINPGYVARLKSGMKLRFTIANETGGSKTICINLKLHKTTNPIQM